MLRIFINWLLQNPVVKFVNSCTSQRLYTAGCCRIDSRLFGSLLLIAALNVFGFTVPSVHAQTPAACIYADSQKLTDSVQVLDARYESALAELKNFGAFTCPEFTQPPPGWESKHKTVLGLNALSTEASNRFAETRCVDFLLLSLFSYRAYFRRSCRQLAPPAPILEEYQRVDASLKKARSLVGQAVFYKADSSSKLLDAFAQNFTPEHDRVAALTKKFKLGLGLGIGAAIVGAGLLIGGGSLQAVNGTQASATGCSVDGLDFGCVRQVDLGARIGLLTAGGVLFVGGILDVLIVRRWIERQTTHSPVGPARLDVRPAPVPPPGAAPAVTSAN